MSIFYVDAHAPAAALTDEQQETMTLALPGAAVVSHNAATGRVRAQFAVDAGDDRGARRTAYAVAAPVLGEDVEVYVSSAEDARGE